MVRKKGEEETVDVEVTRAEFHPNHRLVNQKRSYVENGRSSDEVEFSAPEILLVEEMIKLEQY